jgi:hypothetical protein
MKAEKFACEDFRIFISIFDLNEHKRSFEMIYEKPAGWMEEPGTKVFDFQCKSLIKQTQDDGDGKCLCFLRNLNKRAALSVGLIHQRRKFSINLLSSQLQITVHSLAEGDEEAKKRL